MTTHEDLTSVETNLPRPAMEEPLTCGVDAEPPRGHHASQWVGAMEQRPSRATHSCIVLSGEYLNWGPRAKGEPPVDVAMVPCHQGSSGCTVESRRSSVSSDVCQHVLSTTNL